jgi:DeoR/GlpR family transcriptional regulator of sugar metabolism
MPSPQQIETAARRRVDLLDVIRQHIEAKGYPPNLSELSRITGVHRETVKKDLAVLERERLIERERDGAQGEEFADQRDNDAVRCGERVDGQQAK